MADEVFKPFESVYRSTNLRTKGNPNSVANEVKDLREDVSRGFERVQDQLVEGQLVQNGFENRTDSTMSFDDATGTFSISPVGESYIIWAGGEKYIITETKTVTINTSIEGAHYIYFDSSGAVLDTTTFDPVVIISNSAYCAFVYWDADNSEALLFGDERHGIEMDSATHFLMHQAFGTQYLSGLTIALTTDGNGDNPEHAQFAVSNGRIADEDITHVIADGSPQELTPICKAPIFYRAGASGVWRKIAATDYIVATTGSGRAAWNEFTGATWQLTEVDNNDFVNMHIFATGDLNNPIIIIMGQVEHNSTVSVRAGAPDEISILSLGSLATLTPEFKAIGTAICQSGNGYANAVMTRTRTTDEGDDYIDFRNTNASGSGFTATDHGLLSGLSDDDHPQYLTQDRIVLPSYTVAEANDGVSIADGYVEAQLIYVSDETGGAVPAFYNGTDWRRITDRNIIS